jgi:hypothetical protein
LSFDIYKNTHDFTSPEHTHNDYELMPGDHRDTFSCHSLTHFWENKKSMDGVATAFADFSALSKYLLTATTVYLAFKPTQMTICRDYSFSGHTFPGQSLQGACSPVVDMALPSALFAAASVVSFLAFLIGTYLRRSAKYLDRAVEIGAKKKLATFFKETGAASTSICSIFVGLLCMLIAISIVDNSEATFGCPGKVSLANTGACTVDWSLPVGRRLQTEDSHGSYSGYGTGTHFINTEPSMADDKTAQQYGAFRSSSAMYAPAMPPNYAPHVNSSSATGGGGDDDDDGDDDSNKSKGGRNRSEPAMQHKNTFRENRQLANTTPTPAPPTPPTPEPTPAPPTPVGSYTPAGGSGNSSGHQTKMIPCAEQCETAVPNGILELIANLVLACVYFSINFVR